MSELQRSFAKSKLASLPILFGFDETEDEEEEEEANSKHQSLGKFITRDEDSSSESSISSTSTIKPGPSQDPSTSRPQGSSKKRKYAPSEWSSFFERELRIESESDSVQIVHHVYLTSPSSHKSPLFVMHHGAGSSGLSFAQLSIEIRKQMPSAGILSIDARGHGFTHAFPEQTTADLSLNTLSEDLVQVVNRTKTLLNWQDMPPLILVGHSLGGAVITHIAHCGMLQQNLLCYAVIDVVEGSAMDALKSMQTYLLCRPTSFRSLESAIEWHIRTRTIRNSTSAQVSVPALLEQRNGSSSWTWRTDLATTQPFWQGWFVGMSKKFLEGRAGKLLMLAGTDRLDTELMIGQMQGKFALQIFPEAGHFIHEDLPERVALVLVDFFNRNDRSAFVLPPKVADIIQSRKKV